MILDQFFDVKNGVTVPIPDNWRTSYLHIYVWITSHNYSIPEGLAKKVAQEQGLKCDYPKPRGWWCSRERYHDGPCAARERLWHRIRGWLLSVYL